MELNVKTGIFDMDGTLLNSMPYWRCTTLEYLLAHRLPVEEDVPVEVPLCNEYETMLK